MAAWSETTATLTNNASTLAAKHRNGLVIGNPSDAVMYVRVGATATATAGIPVAAGSSISWVYPNQAPSQDVSIFCAGTSKSFIAYEW